MKDELVNRLLRIPIERRLALAGRTDGATPAEMPIPRVSRAGGVVVSFAQERLWFLWRLAPDSGAYNVALSYAVRGGLDLTALEAAVRDLADRHEVLRSDFAEVDGQVRSFVRAHWDGRVEEVMVSGGRRRAVELAAEFAAQPFDLRSGPLLRVRVFRVDDRECVLVFAGHHIVFDEWSLEVFERELSVLYAARRGGGEPNLPRLAVQYADFAAWQRHTASQGDDPALAYWRERLAGACPTALPADHPRPEVMSFAGKRLLVPVAEQLHRQLAELGAATGATRFMTLLAVFALLLARQSGDTDLCIGTPVVGRSRPETAGLLGFFVNTLVLRVTIDPQATFTDYLRQVRGMVIEAFEHQDAPFEQVVRAVAPHRDAGRNPLFQVMFTYSYQPPQPHQHHLQLTDLTTEELITPTTTAHFDLTLGAVESPQGLLLSFEYNSDLYTDQTIHQLAERLHETLTTITTNPTVQTAQVLAISAAELRTLAEWNNTQFACLRRPVPTLFAEQVRRTPDAVAVEFDGQRWSYGELDAQANRIAGLVGGTGRGIDDVIAVCLRPGPMLLATVLGIWKAGAAFLPIDPTWPAKRMRDVAVEAEPVTLVVERATADMALACERPVVICDDAACVGSSAAEAPTQRADVDLGSLAYVIYTSGSTGRPKGVMIEHQGLVNHAYGQLFPLYDAAGLKPGDAARVAVSASVAFDVFINQLLPLLRGHTLVILSDSERKDPTHFARMASGPGGYDVVDCATAQLDLLVGAGLLTAPRPPRLIIFGGESCSAGLWRRLADHAPSETGHGTLAYNVYGATECSIESTATAVTETVSPTVGRPHGNTQIYVLDSRLQRLPVGAVGEIYIGGDGVGRGYLRRPDLTATAYVPDPFTHRSGARMYRTGDRGRLRADGYLEFWGRRDQQVKVFGQRVELEEIEAALVAVAGVRRAAVVSYPVAGVTRLAAYVLPEHPDAIDPEGLSGRLAEALPAHMVPDTFIVLTELPLTPNGKTDRDALLRRYPPDRGQKGSASGQPQTPLERQISLIWRELLGVPNVGLHDNLFDLGGHSLLAARLIVEINAALGLDLPLHILFANPTVASLSAAVMAAMSTTQGTVANGSSVVVRFGDSAGRQPLALIHPVGGTVFCYRPLAEELFDSFDVVGIQWPGSTHDADYAALAETYASQLRKEFPDHPILIGGWSLGGVLAHAVACELQRSGQDVAGLLLVDADLSEVILRPEQARMDIALLAEIRHHIGDGTVAERLPQMPGAHRLLTTFGVDVAEFLTLNERTTSQLVDCWHAILTGLISHVPGTFHGNAAIFVSRTYDRDVTAALVDSWTDALNGDVDQLAVSGDHFDMLEPHYVGELAKQINEVATTFLERRRIDANG